MHEDEMSDAEVARLSDVHDAHDARPDVFCFTCGAAPGSHTDTAHEPNYALSLVPYVKTHAIARYADGWDVVVESYDDAEIASVIGDATTVADAIEAFSAIIDVWQDRTANAARERHDAIGCAESGSIRGDGSCRWCDNTTFKRSVRMELSDDDRRLLRTFVDGPRIWDAAEVHARVLSLEERGLVAVVANVGGAYAITDAGRHARS